MIEAVERKAGFVRGAYMVGVIVRTPASVGRISVTMEKPPSPDRVAEIQSGLANALAQEMHR